MGGFFATYDTPRFWYELTNNVGLCIESATETNERKTMTTYTPKQILQGVETLQQNGFDILQFAPMGIGNARIDTIRRIMRLAENLQRLEV